MNVLRRNGVYKPLLNRCYQPFKLQTRRVSKQCWDCFGFLKDGTDVKKRLSSACWFYDWPIGWRVWWLGMGWIPTLFLFQQHGVYDYIFRRRTIPPIPVDYDAEYPWRPPAGYVNPLFAPARKWEKIREEKRKKLEENKFNRPFYFKKVRTRSRFHKYPTGGR
eukprot:UN00736